MRMFLPSIHPACCIASRNGRRKVSAVASSALDANPTRTPMWRIRSGCWARTARGHAITLPPSTPRNRRRFIDPSTDSNSHLRYPRAPAKEKSCAADHITALLSGVCVLSNLRAGEDHEHTEGQHHVALEPTETSFQRVAPPGTFAPGAGQS